MLIEAGKECIRAAYVRATNQGADIRYVTAHRCWSGQRGGDPGEAIWNQIVVPMMVELELVILEKIDAGNGGREIPW